MKKNKLLTIGITGMMGSGKSTALNFFNKRGIKTYDCLLYTSPSPRDGLLCRMPSSA